MSLASSPVSRKDLYELVWAEPMTKVAPRFGLSGGALAKGCNWYNIPRPPVGFTGRLSRRCDSKAEAMLQQGWLTSVLSLPSPTALILLGVSVRSRGNGDHRFRLPPELTEFVAANSGEGTLVRPQWCRLEPIRIVALLICPGRLRKQRLGGACKITSPHIPTRDCNSPRRYCTSRTNMGSSLVRSQIR